MQAKGHFENFFMMLDDARKIHTVKFMELTVVSWIRSLVQLGLLELGFIISCLTETPCAVRNWEICMTEILN